MSISPEQCRAARGLLNLSQAEVAESAHVFPTTLTQFERGATKLNFNYLQAIRTALEAAGVVFIAANGDGPGARLRLKRKAGAVEKALFSPEQCRAARAMLNLSQTGLAKAAGVGRSTVADYERGARVPNPENLAALRRALKAAGVIFVAADDVAGPGVRLQR